MSKQTLAALLIVISTSWPAGAQLTDQYCTYRDSLGNEFMGFPSSTCAEACEDAEKDCRNAARVYPNEYGPNTPKGRALSQSPNRQCYYVSCGAPRR